MEAPAMSAVDFEFCEDAEVQWPTMPLYCETM